MRHMYLLTGAPGSGKSTYIKETIEKHRLGRVISWDAYRARYRHESPAVLTYTPTEDGFEESYVQPLSGAQEKAAIKTSYIDTDVLMRTDETIFVDNTNTLLKNMRGFLDLAEQYSYKVWLIDIQGDQTLEEIQERNARRTSYKKVPEHTVSKMHKQNIELHKNWRTMLREYPRVQGYIKPADLMEHMASRVNFRDSIHQHIAIDLANTYDRVCILGDVQGMGNTLEAALEDLAPGKGLDDKKTLWVFIGDLFDRGNTPTKVADITFPHLIKGSDNVKLINGNHESQILNVLAGVNTVKDSLITVKALKEHGYSEKVIKDALSTALPAAELRLDSVEEDGGVSSKYLYLSHAGVHPKLYADSAYAKQVTDLRPAKQVGSIYRYPLKHWETGYSESVDILNGRSTYEGWAEPLNALYAKATQMHKDEGGHPNSELIAVCGHRGNYGDPTQYRNLIPLESKVEHAGGHLSVAVFTAEKASFKRYSGGRTFRHKWNYERRQYEGDSDTVDTWVSTSQRAKRQK